MYMEETEISFMTEGQFMSRHVTIHGAANSCRVCGNSFLLPTYVNDSNIRDNGRHSYRNELCLRHMNLLRNELYLRYMNCACGT